MVLGVLIIALAVAEVLASKLLTELPLLRLVAGLEYSGSSVAY